MSFPISLNKLLAAFRPERRVGLALSGGVARGLAHIGVLKVLKKHKIPIHCLAGTSAGALVGAFFAAGMSPDLIEKNAKKLGWFRFLKFIPGRHGPLEVEEIRKFIIENIGDIKFSDLNLPFAAVACDIKTGNEVILSEGKVARAVAASFAFPGIFAPVKHHQELLVDGGIVDNLPSSVLLKMGANFVIAVDVVPGRPLKEDPENALQVFGRAIDLTLKKFSQEGRRSAQVLIEPEIPEDIWQLDIDEAPRLIKAGEEAALAKLLALQFLKIG